VRYFPLPLLALFLAAWVSALCGVPGASTPVSEPEDELKSAIVLSFLRYSEFPARAAARDVPLVVGTLGRASFEATLRRALEGKTANGRPIRVVPFKAADAACCSLVYFATGKSAEIRQALESAHAAHALTIGETEEFLEYGGAVYLFLVDGHFGFEVSLDSLGRSGISISSTMLRFGQIRGRAP
jgi:hypothetical protein